MMANTLHYAFKRVRNLVLMVYPELHHVEWKFCAQADDEHEESDRQYMHTLHKEGVICVAHAASDLLAPNVYGLFLHEFGHLIADLENLPGHVGDDEILAEDEADDVIYRNFGILIEYDDRTVQEADPRLLYG